MTEPFPPDAPILLTGATGFVGQALYPGLIAAGYSVRCATRNVKAARTKHPDREWVSINVDYPGTLPAAMAGCRAAYYLVHAMADGTPNYRQREALAAERFARAAADAGLERIIYLGGVAPPSDPSEHLLSRIECGAVLRAGRVPVIEFRCGMIVGHGSTSWLIVRDIAAHLPIMILPAWTETLSEPVAIDDVVTALVAALALPITESEIFDLPGPEKLSARDIILQTAAALDLPRPITIEVPVLSPRLSSYWLRFMTRADWAVARELVLGLQNDLLAHDDRYWSQIGHTRRLTFKEAAARALAAEAADGDHRGLGAFIERLRRRRRVTA